MNIHKKWPVALAITCGCLILSGCSSMAGHNNVDQALINIENFEYEEAEQNLSEAENANEDVRLLCRARGILYRTLGNYEDAANEFLKSLAATDGIPGDMDFDTNFYLADVYIKLGRYSDAISVYDAILDIRKRDRNAYYMRGIARLKNQDHDGADSDFNKAMELSPKDTDLWIMIYKALSESGYEEEGLSILQECLENGNSNMTNYEKGQISYYLGNNADAQSYLELARNERDTQKAPVVLLLGQTGERQGDYNYAVSVYKTFLSEDPEHPDIYNQLGLCQIKMGDYESAVSSFEAGLALGDTKYYQALLLNEITAYEYAGNFTQAKALMEKYRKAYPDDSDAEREELFLSTR